MAAIARIAAALAIGCTLIVPAASAGSVYDADWYKTSMIWDNCLQEAASGLAGQPEPAAVIADSAFSLCFTEEMDWQQAYMRDNPTTDIFLASQVQKKTFRDKIVARVLVLRAARERQQPKLNAPAYRPM